MTLTSRSVSPRTAIPELLWPVLPEPLGSSANVGLPVVSMPNVPPFRGNPARAKSTVAFAGVGAGGEAVVDTKLAPVTIPGATAIVLAMSRALIVGVMAAEAG